MPPAVVWVLIILSAFKPVQGSGYMINTVGYFETQDRCEAVAKQILGSIKDKKAVTITVCTEVSHP
jgi:hypothetical protein